MKVRKGEHKMTFLSPKEVAEQKLLPGNPSEKTIRNMIKDRRIPAINIGLGTKKNRWLISPADIEDYKVKIKNQN